ncbi:MAG: efflux RND transporter periplasmic adaptor subunit [Rhodoferax sp.]|nr:efflux RND transporter periplasmic adaptor subunit [Rhodoferax sp.]
MTSSPFPEFSARAARRPLRMTLIAFTAAWLAACQPVVDDAKADEPTPVASLPLVRVAPVVQHMTDLVHVQIARIEAAQRVDIRPRVAGQIDAVLFKEGERVAAGQPLFRIDPRPFEIALASAQAQLRMAQAREALARQSADRARELAQASAIATETVERRQAGHAEALAAVQAAQAAVDAARLELEHTTVRAPIAGRVGRALSTVGNQVSASVAQAPLVVLLSSELHLHLDAPVALLQPDTSAPARPSAWLARLLADDGQAAPQTLPVSFMDNQVDAATGTVRLRVRLGQDGAAGRMAGQFVRAGLVSRRPQPSLWVPDKAVGTDQGRHYVLVVTPDGTVDYRVVESGPLRDGLRQIRNGLQAGERVVTEGFMRVRPGARVQVAAPGDMPQAGTTPANPDTRG